MSSAMGRVFDALAREAPLCSPIALLGETGVGKQLLARAVWTLGRSKSGPFVVVDGASSDLDSFDRELDEHPSSAFSRAAGGVLYVRNADELPHTAQEALHRLFAPTAARARSEKSHARPRLIVSSRRDMQREARAGRLVVPLFELLATHIIAVPSLRARIDDVAALLPHLLARLHAPMELATEELREALRAHDWPGNVRELERVLDAVARENAGEGRSPFVRRGGENGPSSPPFDPAKSFGEQRKENESLFEQRYLTWLLARNEGNLSRAAREARMDRKHLRDLARRHGLHLLEIEKQDDAKQNSPTEES